MHAAIVSLLVLGAIVLTGFLVLARGLKLRWEAQARGEECLGENGWEHAGISILVVTVLFCWPLIYIATSAIVNRDDPDDWHTNLDPSEYVAHSATVERITLEGFYEATGMPAEKHEDMLSLIPICQRVALESAQATFHEVSESHTPDGVNGKLLEPWRGVLAVSYEQPTDRFWIANWYWPDLHEKKHASRREFAEVLLNATEARQLWDYMDSRHPVSNLTDAEQLELYALLKAVVEQMQADPEVTLPSKRGNRASLERVTDWCVENWEWVSANG